MSDYTYKDNTKEVLSALDKAIETALKTIGSVAEGHAKEVLSETVYTREKDPQGYRLTGRLRNSITFALADEEPNAKTYNYTVDDMTYTAEYEGKAPADTEKNKKVVYIGTNVEYAEGIETGSHRKAGAVHYLLKAATEHKDEYKKITKDILSNAEDG